MKKKYTIEIITGDKLVERNIIADKFSITDTYIIFYKVLEKAGAPLGGDIVENIHYYPKNFTIITKIEYND